MALDLCFVREKVLNKSLTIQDVPALFQVADVLAKAPFPTRLLELRAKLNVWDPLEVHPP